MRFEFYLRSMSGVMKGALSVILRFAAESAQQQQQQAGFFYINHFESDSHKVDKVSGNPKL